MLYLNRVDILLDNGDKFIEPIQNVVFKSEHVETNYWKSAN